MFERFLVPVYMPRWLFQAFAKKKPVPPPQPPKRPIDIWGERNVEWTFLSKEIPDGPGAAIEFGCENGYMSLMAAEKGFTVLANDLLHQDFTWEHPLVTFQEGDFLKIDLPSNHFDLAINCSSVEHVGIAGRYGITLDQDEGDIQVMQRLADVLKPGGLLLMTAPCGQDAILAPWCRVYGPARLPRILEPFQVLKQTFWMKNPQNRWVECSRETALALEPTNDPLDGHACIYNLSCFVLRKPLAS